MAATNYERCLANTLNEEGGWSNHPSDPGGPTMRGVIQARYDEYRRKWGKPLQSVRYITEAELQIIYRDGYWDKVAGDRWPKGPDQIVFDIGVNSGPARGLAILAAAMGTASRDPVVLASMASRSADHVGIVKRACGRRASFYRGIRTFGVFGRGWLARNARMEAIAVKMCLEASGSGAVYGNLDRESAMAAKRARRAGQGAAGAGAAGSAGGGAAVPQDLSAWAWTDWLAFGLCALALAALGFALFYAWRKHGERAKAYAAAAAGRLETNIVAVWKRVQASGENSRRPASDPTDDAPPPRAGELP